MFGAGPVPLYECRTSLSCPLDWLLNETEFLTASIFVPWGMYIVGPIFWVVPVCCAVTLIYVLPDGD